MEWISNKGCNFEDDALANGKPMKLIPEHRRDVIKFPCVRDQWSAPTQDSNPGGRIQNHKRWPLATLPLHTLYHLYITDPETLVKTPTLLRHSGLTGLHRWSIIEYLQFRPLSRTCTNNTRLVVIQTKMAASHCRLRGSTHVRFIRSGNIDRILGYQDVEQWLNVFWTSVAIVWV